MTAVNLGGAERSGITVVITSQHFHKAAGHFTHEEDTERSEVDRLRLVLPSLFVKDNWSATTNHDFQY